MLLTSCKDWCDQSDDMDVRRNYWFGQNQYHPQISKSEVNDFGDRHFNSYLAATTLSSASTIVRQNDSFHHSSVNSAFKLTGQRPLSSMAAVKIDSSVFSPSAISADTNAFNTKLIEIMRGAPKWFEVGAAKYREMRARGETPLPPAKLLDSAVQSSIPSRDAGRDIPIRILKPQNGQATGIYLHIHGGGWVLQTEQSQDIVLQDLADTNNLLMVSVGYRLAPEHPFPAGPNDCYDVAEHILTSNPFNLPLLFVGGESAGAHLSLLTMLHLANHQNPKFSSFTFKGLILHFGAYDLTFLPGAYNFKVGNPGDILVLSKELMDHYVDVFLPGMSMEQRKQPEISPMYADLEALRGRLPPVLFTCGTMDCLLDDTVFMSSKWQMAGGQCDVLIVPGGAHGYCMFPKDTVGAQADVAMKAVETFIAEHQ